MTEISIRTDSPLQPRHWFRVGQKARATSVKNGRQYTANSGAAIEAVHVYDQSHVVVRFVTGDKTLPFQLVEFEGEYVWVQKGFSGAVYNESHLEDTTRTTLIVGEGEKVVDAIGEVVTGMSATITWAGGASALAKSKLCRRGWLPEHIQHVLLVPDWDIAGLQAMHSLATWGAVSEHPSVRFVTPNGEVVPYKWDIADVERRFRLAYFDKAHISPALSDAAWDKVAKLHAEHVTAAPWDGQRLQRWAAELAEEKVRNEILSTRTPALEEYSPGLAGIDIDRSVEIYAWPDMSDGGKPRDTYANLLVLLTEQRWVVSYNEITKEIDAYRVRKGFTNDERWWEHVDKVNAGTIQLDHVYEHIIDAAISYRMPHSRLPKLLDVVAARNTSNPVRQWLDPVTWDGITRFDELYASLNIVADADAHALNRVLLRKWLIQAIAAALDVNGCHGSGVLVLTGGEGTGKTAWFRSLVSGIRGLFKEGRALDPHSVDSVIQATSAWICELGEIDATFRKADLAALKAFLLKDTDEYRASYDRKRGKHARRTVFCGTVNDIEFLSEPGAHRRFWPVEITGDIDWQHGIDMAQLWAEARSWYEAGETWHLNRELIDQLSSRNAHVHVRRNGYDDELAVRFDWDAPARTILTATEILRVVHDGQLPSNLRAAQTQMGQALQRFVPPGDKIGGKVTRYRVPEPLSGPRGENGVPADLNDDLW